MFEFFFVPPNDIDPLGTRLTDRGLAVAAFVLAFVILWIAEGGK